MLKLTQVTILLRPATLWSPHECTQTYSTSYLDRGKPRLVPSTPPRPLVHSTTCAHLDSSPRQRLSTRLLDDGSRLIGTMRNLVSTRPKTIVRRHLDDEDSSTRLICVTIPVSSERRGLISSARRSNPSFVVFWTMCMPITNVPPHMPFATSIDVRRKPRGR